jgi:hypothetical protein
MRPAGLVALGAALVALALPSTGGGVLTTASPAPSYMSGLGTRFDLPSNGRFTNAERVTVLTSTNPLNKPEGKAEPVSTIWTDKCRPRKKQTAKFRRTVEIPGPPSAARFQIEPQLGNFSSPLKRYVLEINGAKAVERSLRSTSTAKLGPKQLKLFRNGLNEIEVTVKRGELPQRVRRCNTSKKNRVAVLFNLGGDFAADLGLVEPPPPTQYKKAGSPSRTVIVNLSLTNHGPSGLVAGAGTFTAQASGATRVAIAGREGDPKNPQVVALGPPFSNCQLTGTRVDCELGLMPARDSGVLSMYVQQDFRNTDFGETTTTIKWLTRSGPVSDPRFDNNDRGVTIVWCGDKATSPGCASAQ